MAVNGESLVDSYLWLTEPACEEFLLRSPLADLAAEAMDVSSVRLFYDQVFIKRAGHSQPTKWHQDIAHWPLDGSQTCSIWLAVDAVSPQGGALRYLAGSHRWGRLFRPWEGSPGEAPPDFESASFRACECSFDLAAGDCAIHNGRTVHASHANRMPGTRRVAYVTRWLGPEVRFEDKGFVPPFPIPVSFRDGAPVDHPLFPEFPRRPRTSSSWSQIPARCRV